MNRRTFVAAAGASAVSLAGVGLIAGPTTTKAETMSGEKIRVIDTHVHIYDPRQLDYPWLVNVPPIDKPHLFEDYYAYTDAAFDLESFVFVEVAAADEQWLAEAEWITGAAEDNPKLGAVVAQALLEKGGAVRPDLERLAQLPRMRGIRRILAEPFQTDINFALRPEFIEGVRLLPEFDMSFDIGISEYNLPNVVKFVSQCPNVTFIVNHIGKPLIKDGKWEPWRTHMRALAAMDNVSVKISGLLTEAGGPEIDKIAPYVHEVVGMYGIDRVMYGSDYPVQDLAGGTSTWFETIAKIMSSYTDEERRKYFSENAKRIYRIT